MWNMITLKTIGTMVVCAGIGSLFSRRVKLPHIVLYILTGLVLGQLEIALLEKDILAQSKSSVSLISQSGIALLLFLVGLELSLEKVKDIGADALVAGLWQVALTALIAFGLGVTMGFGASEAIALGIAMTFSSTVVVVKLLGEKRHLGALYGRMSIGILLVQDLVVIFAFTILAGMKGAQQDVMSVGLELGKAFVGVGVLFVFTMYVAKKVVGPIMNWASSSTETLLVWSLTWCFLIVAFAHFLGLSHEIGAFLAGVSLAQLRLSNSLKQRVHPLMNFFIGIFFISLGMEIDLGTALANWRPALGFVLFVLFGKVLIFLFVLSRRGFSERTSFMLAITMAQISEFSFLFIALARGIGWVGDAAVAVVALTGLVSFVVSSFMITRNQDIYRLFSSKSLLVPFQITPKRASNEFPTEKRGEHVIVIGMNSLGREICIALSKIGQRALAIDNDPKKLEGLPCETLVGNADYASILEEASFASAILVVTTLRIEDVNNSLVYRCKKMGIPVAAHGFDSSVIPELKRLGADYVIDTRSSWLRRLVRELEARGVALP